MAKRTVKPQKEPEKGKREAEFRGREPPPPAERKREKAAEQVAHEAVERAEREEPPIGGEFDLTPPGFERD